MDSDLLWGRSVEEGEGLSVIWTSSSALLETMKLGVILEYQFTFYLFLFIVYRCLR